MLLNNPLSAVIYGKSMNYSKYLSRTSICNILITFTRGGHNGTQYKSKYESSFAPAPSTNAHNAFVLKSS